jgi:hypothetical protein
LCPITRMHGKISLVIANKAFENAVQIFWNDSNKWQLHSWRY